jgi:hypothetical protein
VPAGGTNRAFGQLAADVIWLLVISTRQRIPDLLLARLIVGDGKRHQLLERHAVLGIDVEKLLRDGGEL